MGQKISCKVEEMVSKVKNIKGCHILAEMTTQLNQKNVEKTWRLQEILLFWLNLEA